MKPAVASIDPIKVIKIFESWDAASQYAREHPDQFLSVSTHKNMKAAKGFAKYLHDMTPDWKVEFV
jgi:hypothetical protein